MRPRFEEKTLEWIHANPSPGRVILLCGFFGILSKEFLQSCGAPVVNTHPSLLPAFPGLDKGVHRQAFESVSVSGFSVHMVTEALDGGPLLFQHPVWLDPHLSFDEARDSVRAAEQKWLPRIWEKILKSDLDVADAALTSRELRARRDLDLRSFAEEIQKEVQSETPNKE
jgi:folate-dependent phosphoribosylglycinamide formyltransferase PurN